MNMGPKATNCGKVFFVVINISEQRHKRKCSPKKKTNTGKNYHEYEQNKNITKNSETEIYTHKNFTRKSSNL